MFQQDQKNHLFYKKESSHWKTRRTTSSAKRKVLTARIEKPPLLGKGKFLLQNQKNHLFCKNKFLTARLEKIPILQNGKFSLQGQKNHFLLQKRKFSLQDEKNHLFCKKESSHCKTRKTTSSAKRKVLTRVATVREYSNH